MATVEEKRRTRTRKKSVEEVEGPLVLFHMTSDQFCELPPCEDVKLELLDGAVIMSPRPRRNHQHFFAQLLAALILWTNTKKSGRVLPEMLMKLDGKWSPAPDLVFVARKHLKRVKEKRIEGPVDLAVEILSPSTEKIDRETKFVAYARYGIRWYWIVDVDARILEEYELTGDQYGPPVKAPFDKPFRPRLFPGLEIDLASLEW